MGEVWPTAYITELRLQLTAGSRPANGDEHRALWLQSCERALLTMGDLSLPLPSVDQAVIISVFVPVFFLVKSC